MECGANGHGPNRGGRTSMLKPGKCCHWRPIQCSARRAGAELFACVNAGREEKRGGPQTQTRALCWGDGRPCRWVRDAEWAWAGGRGTGWHSHLLPLCVHFPAGSRLQRPCVSAQLLSNLQKPFWGVKRQLCGGCQGSDKDVLFPDRSQGRGLPTDAIPHGGFGS